MLNYLIFFPLIAAFVVLLVKRGGVKVFSVVVSFMILVLNFEIFVNCLQGNDFNYQLSFKILKFFTYHIGVNSISLTLMLLSSLMIFLSFLFLKIEQKTFVSSIFFLEFSIMGLFSAKDGILFYVFWEFSLLPILYIIGVYGKDFKAGIKFFIYAFSGSILMLVALIYQAYLNYQLLNIFTFDLEIWKNNASAINFIEQSLLFGAFFIAFAIKAPLFPFHTWAPKLYTNSPVFISVMLVVFKMAPYGFLLFCLPLFPDASVYFMPLIVILCILSIIYNALIAYKSTNIKELIAYSSISHLGVMILGIFSLNSLGISGAVFYMFAHGIVTGSLFLMIELLYQRYHTYDICFYHSLAKKSPLFSIFFILILLASISLPLTISFVGEFLILLGIAKIHLFYAFLAGFVVILGAIYMFAIFRKMFFMQAQNTIESFSLRFREIGSLSCVVIIIFYLGLVPNMLLKPIQKDVDELIKIMNIRAIEQDSLSFLSQMGEVNVK
ncbi:NADH-quinone oxidoreductase subunit M [Campylobacter hepaticus]|uniref:NADH-quinone oxidoreductase subunit M n=1 Tax=Campylobacter hepaticus TaxID=1813019 RepID=UPI0029AF3861|nr:NADH-quinone oxidoreductase subunit M [Campylobacter hepaticus]MDX2331455.1 NADH-quinone oxidoreductase subunit M [Campylobacter hepaticus]MDX2371974.1 NADH-quinone oxidoreductase subunit M [Campylobacter hepaticus]MDX2397291.1 NADH-quinone oxidoreductase subunit M [Campylobacter hepaticus]MDX5509227.1 NADH-quinone oxidoreductase subunit M [Campylobacter hepaticus]